MPQLSNKIQIPIKTKIVSIFALVSAIFVFIFLVLISIYSSNFLFAVIRNWILLVIISIDIIACRLLIDGRNIGWFFSLGIFGLYFLNFVSVAITPLHSLEYIDFRQVYAFLSIPNLVAVVILLVDRKNYFAAVERAKNKTKQI